MSTAVCRVCLAGGDVRMHSIEDVQLLKIYEKLTDTKLYAGDERPSSLCYICYQQLRRCRAFSETAQRAERILRDLARGTRTIHDAITAQNLRLPRPLSVSAAQHLTIEDSASADSRLPSTRTRRQYNYNWMPEAPLVTVKEERVAVKEEEAIKGDILMEMEESAPTEIKERSIDSDDKTSSEPLKVPCEHCNRTFKNARSLRAHSATCGRRFTLSQERSHACDACGKRFKQRSHLTVHARIHSGERSFACEICGKTFNQLANLNKHRGIHGGAKPHACQICGKAFLQRAQVVAHVRSHTGEKPYACARCGAAYSHAAPLRRHACGRGRGRGGGGEARAHACSVCSARFLEARALARHSRQVHAAARAHACTQCGAAFKRAQHLARHARSSRCRPPSPPRRGACT